MGRRSSFSFCLTLIALQAACSSAPRSDRAEPVASASQALGASVADLTVSPADTLMVVAYTRIGGAGPLTVSLSGPGGSSVAATPVGGTNESATFSGLTPCTSYAWTIAASGGTVAAGQTNTRAIGIAPCPATESISNAQVAEFRALHHEENGGPWCSSSDWNFAYKDWPLTEAWETELRNAPGAGPRVGYIHFSNGASGPFPCYESATDTRRGYVVFNLTPLQVQRRPSGTFSATVNGNQGPCITTLASQSYLSWNLPDGPAPYQYSTVFEDLEGTPPNGRAIGHDDYAAAYPLHIAGNQISADVYVGPTGVVRVGFEGRDNLGDGPVAPTSFPQDNESCTAQFSNVSLALSYPPMPPETPLGCAGTVGCTRATVSCAWSPEVFTLVTHTAGQADRVAATFDATAGPVAVNLADPIGTPASTYSVCSGSVCSPVPMTNTCDFSLATATRISMPAGATWPVELEATGTYAGPIAVSLAAAPASLFSGELSPTTLNAGLEDPTITTASATYLVVSAGYQVAPQSAMLTLTGTGGGQTHSLQIPLTITACEPATCAAQGMVCGSLSDGCGGTVTCGKCAAAETCSDDQTGCCSNTSPPIARAACLSGKPPTPPVHCIGDSCQ